MSAELALPPIALADLSERSKDLILGLASGLECTPEEALVRVLDHCADVQLPPLAFAQPVHLAPAIEAEPSTEAEEVAA